MQTFLVGGSVRDMLLNLPCEDKDYLITGASPEDMLNAGFTQVGANFPVFLHPETKDEYALARVERKTNEGYHGFSFTTENVTLEQDLKRRDLTINAMAMAMDTANGESGEIIDLFGGKQDLADKVLRHTSDAFTEDPLRILRVARFHARLHHLGFSIAPETITIMKRLVSSGSIKSLTAERVWKEMRRALMETTPSVFFKTLLEVGALDVIMPELSRLNGVPQPPKHHPEIDTFVHTLMALDKSVELGATLNSRYAVLVHDLGKGLTEKGMLPQHHGHEKSGVPLVEALNRRFKIPNKTARMGVLVTKFHTHSHKAMELRTSSVLKLFKSLRCHHHPEILDEFLIATQSDAQGRLGLTESPYPQSGFLKELLNLSLSVNSKDFIVEGDPVKTGVAIEQAKLRAIKKGINAFKA